MTKRQFQIGLCMRRIRAAVEEYADAAMFELADAGFGSVFQQLVACIISIRTRDEVSLPAARRLLGHAGSAEAMARLAPSEIDELIHDATFHTNKAQQIHDIARRTAEEFGGELPCDVATLTSFKGVGPKCAHLALGVACGEAHIAVDVHVWRVTNRWGYVEGNTPEKTLLALEQKLPRRYWVEINRLLVPFGKHVCTGQRPKCSTCLVLDMCQQVGVTTHR